MPVLTFDAADFQKAKLTPQTYHCGTCEERLEVSIEEQWEAILGDYNIGCYNGCSNWLDRETVLGWYE